MATVGYVMRLHNDDSSVVKGTYFDHREHQPRTDSENDQLKQNKGKQ